MILLLAVLVVVFAGVPSPWSLVVILVGCVLEVAEIAILRNWSRRIGRRTKPTTGAESMIGRPAEVVEPCRPKGRVELDGELWQARCKAGADIGDTVRVESVDGLTLVVVP